MGVHDIAEDFLVPEGSGVNGGDYWEVARPGKAEWHLGLEAEAGRVPLERRNRRNGTGWLCRQKPLTGSKLE